MSKSRDVLEDQLQEYEMQLKSLKSYIKELNDMTKKHGTDSAHFESDLFEAEHNIKYYKDEIARLKGEIRSLGSGPGRGGGGGGGGGGATAMLPQTVKQGVGTLILAMIGFGVGALLGSKCKSWWGSHDSPE